jgi:hypothetical protein
LAGADSIRWHDRLCSWDTGTTISAWDRAFYSGKVQAPQAWLMRQYHVGVAALVLIGTKVQFSPRLAEKSRRQQCWQKWC